MNLFFCCNWLFVFAPLAVCTQNLYIAQHPAYMTGDAYSRHFTDPYSFTANQAVLGYASQPQIAILSERRFMLKELDLYSCVASMPLPAGGMGLRLDYSGFAEYNESNAGLAYGKKLGNKLAIGIAFNYRSVHVSGYRNAGYMNAEAGMLIHPDEKIHIGLHYAIPFAPAKYYQRQAAVYTMGIGYEASGQVLISMEIIKEASQPVNLRASIDYVMEKQFFASLGMETGDTAPYGKAGWQWKQMRVSVGAVFHPKLGCTALFMIMAEGKNRHA